MNRIVVKKVVAVILKTSEEQGVSLTKEEALFLIEEADSFTDEDLGAAIGNTAVPIFRELVGMAKLYA